MTGQTEPDIDITATDPTGLDDPDWPDLPLSQGPWARGSEADLTRSGIPAHSPGTGPPVLTPTESTRFGWAEGAPGAGGLRLRMPPEMVREQMPEGEDPTWLTDGRTWTDCRTCLTPWFRFQPYRTCPICQAWSRVKGPAWRERTRTARGKQEVEVNLRQAARNRAAVRSA